MASPNVVVVQQALHAYGEAMRSDWGDMDGRTVRDDLDALAALLNEDAPETTLDEALQILCIENVEGVGYRWS